MDASATTNPTAVPDRSAIPVAPPAARPAAPPPAVESLDEAREFLRAMQGDDVVYVCRGLNKNVLSVRLRGVIENVTPNPPGCPSICTVRMLFEDEHKDLSFAADHVKCVGRDGWVGIETADAEFVIYRA